MNTKVDVVPRELQAHVNSTKTIVLHYHLFKNAGTSIDSCFKDSLNDGEWITREFTGSLVKKRKDLRDWIRNNTEAKCFSSHTAALPPPQIDDVNILPIIFIRHPLDRIASAYAFEEKQNSSTFGSVLARNTSLAGYIETRLSIPNDFQCRNFHAVRLAEMYSEETSSIEERALQAVSELPFIGMVEEFDKSINTLQMLLGQTSLSGTNIVAKRKNVSQNAEASLEKKLETLKKRIGKSLFHELEQIKSIDLKLFEAVLKIYAAEEE